MGECRYSSTRFNLGTRRCLVHSPPVPVGWEDGSVVWRKEGIMSEGRDDDATVRRDSQLHLGVRTLVSARLSNQISIRVQSPVNQPFCLYAVLA
jgi:hypothetical protein